MNRQWQDLDPGLQRISNEADVRELLDKYGPSYGQRYTKWAEEHPIANFAIERGVDVAMNEIPGGRILRKIPGLRTVGEALEAASKVGQLGGWNPEYIRDPKLKWGDAKKVYEGESGSKSYEVPIQSRDGSQTFGSIHLLMNPDESHGHVQWMEADLPKGTGPGHLLHIKDELADQFPNMDSVTFMRITGARAKHGAAEVSRTMPIGKGGGKSEWHGDPTAKQWDVDVAKYGGGELQPGEENLPVEPSTGPSGTVSAVMDMLARRRERMGDISETTQSAFQEATKPVTLGERVRAVLGGQTRTGDSGRFQWAEDE